MKPFWLSIFHVSTTLLGANAQFVRVYTPPEAMTLPGNTRVMANHWEYQQIFDASLFNSIPRGEIRSIDLRASLNSGFRDTQLTGILIELSTTPKTVNSLSPVFSENLGSDKFLNWSGQSVAFASASTMQGIKIWSPTFSVLKGNGFYYDPSKGSLLMTIHNLHLPESSFGLSYDGVRDSPLTASVRADGEMERGTFTSEGLVVKFVFTDVVPEPSGFALLVLGSAALLGIRAHTSGRKNTDVLF